MPAHTGFKKIKLVRLNDGNVQRGYNHDKIIKTYEIICSTCVATLS